VKLFEATKIPVLGRALDAYSLRHKAIATVWRTSFRIRAASHSKNNSGALGSDGLSGSVTHPNHMPIGQNSIATVQPTVEQPDTASNPQQDAMASGLNNVDLDQEMAELAKNQIRFRFSARLLSETFRGLQKSIRGTQ
jgi:flagellar basal-body rod protein FlgB